jgi:uncharacterized protein
MMAETPSDVAFSTSVKTVQQARGSRGQFERQADAGGWPTAISDDLARFIATVSTCYLATASADGQPYVQHRGGPPGFLHVLDRTTIAFADFKGNQQYISTGNLAENARVHLFLMDYENRRRVKLWGTARIVSDDAALTERLFPSGYRARVEQVIVVTVATWDMNCSQHIPLMFHAVDVAEKVRSLQTKITDLEAELARLKATPAA